MWMVALDRPGCGIDDAIEARTESEALRLFRKKHRCDADTCWCTVGVNHKVGLGLSNEEGNYEKAFEKCREFKFDIYGE